MNQNNHAYIERLNGKIMAIRAQIQTEYDRLATENDEAIRCEMESNLLCLYRRLSVALTKEVEFLRIELEEATLNAEAGSADPDDDPPDDSVDDPLVDLDGGDWE